MRFCFVDIIIYYFEKERIHLENKLWIKISLQKGLTFLHKAHCQASAVACLTLSPPLFTRPVPMIIHVTLVRTSLHLFPDHCLVDNWPVGALWCTGSRSRLAIRRSVVRIPLGAYALRQGILSTIVSLDPGVVNGYPAGIYSFECS